MVESKIAGVVGVFIGAVVGTGLAFWQNRAADAAVDVRPELADVGGFDAFLANHFTDWLFYNHEPIGFVVIISLSALLTGVMFWSSA